MSVIRSFINGGFLSLLLPFLLLLCVSSSVSLAVRVQQQQDNNNNNNNNNYYNEARLAVGGLRTRYQCFFETSPHTKEAAEVVASQWVQLLRRELTTRLPFPSSSFRVALVKTTRHFVILEVVQVDNLEVEVVSRVLYQLLPALPNLRIAEELSLSHQPYPLL
jgi:hypothetical protein